MDGRVHQGKHRPLLPTAGSCVQQVHSSPPSALAWWFPNRWEGSNFIRGTAAGVCDDAVTGAGRSAGRCCPSGWVFPAGMAASTTSGSMHGTPILSWRSHWVEKPQYRRLSSRGGTATVRQPTMPRHLLLLSLCLFAPCCDRHAASQAIRCDPHAPALIRPLIDPAKLATLGDRGANQRIQKITAILWDVKADGEDVAAVAAKAVELIGWGGTDRGNLTAAGMVRNLTILERLGSTTPADLTDLAEMKRGRAAKVRIGPYVGEVLSVDHIVPRAVAPELDNVIANLELMPMSLNRQKSDTAGRKSGTLIQALRHLGQDQINDQTLTTLRCQITDGDRPLIQKDLHHAPAWIADFLCPLTERLR